MERTEIGPVLVVPAQRGSAFRPGLAPSHALAARARAFCEETGAPTPCLVLDLSVVRAQLGRLRAELPGAHVMYAVKANPDPRVLRALHAAGAGFDVASAGEVQLCLSLGIPASLLSFGHTVKRREDVAAAWAAGVGEFALDSVEELDKIALHAPGARVFARVACDGSGADWPLGTKFGCSPERAGALLLLARDRGLRPMGVSFHVGSQQRDPARWVEAVDTAALVLERCAGEGLVLESVNLGGGWPARTDERVLELSRYGEVVREALARLPSHVRVLLEPGRFLVADAGVIQTSVVGTQLREDGHRWAFLDAGLYNGLFEGWDAVARFQVRAGAQDSTPCGPWVLAGPTCDSMDVLNHREPVDLPLGLAEGDVLTVLCAGAYTSSCSSVGFNGFDALPVHCVEGEALPPT